MKTCLSGQDHEPNWIFQNPFFVNTLKLSIKLQCSPLSRLGEITVNLDKKSIFRIAWWISVVLQDLLEFSVHIQNIFNILILIHQYKLFLHSRQIIYCQRTHSNNNILVNLPFHRIIQGKCFCAYLDWLPERPHLLYFHEFWRRWKVLKPRFYRILCSSLVIEEGPREVYCNWTNNSNSASNHCFRTFIILVKEKVFYKCQYTQRSSTQQVPEYKRKK